MFTFESIITPAGIAAVGVVVMALIQLLKTVFPSLSDIVNGLQQAFIFTAVIYVLGAFVLSPLDANGYLTIFLSWLLAASAAVASYEAAVRAQLVQTPTQNAESPPKG